MIIRFTNSLHALRLRPRWDAIKQHFLQCPHVVSQSGRHRRRTRPPHLRRAPAVGRLGNPQRLAQARMWQDKVVVGVEQRQLMLQAVLALTQRVNTTPYRRHALPNIQIQPVTVDGGIAPSTPGSRAGLLPPSPLRTARESFPSSSSSLANAPCGTRSCHVQHMRWHDLHHTRLEPPHRHPVGECTSQCRHCRHLLSLLKRLAKVSGEARPDGRQLACAWGDVA